MPQVQLWTVTTTDDRNGDHAHVPYVVDLVTDTVEQAGIFSLVSNLPGNSRHDADLGSFPDSGITAKSFVTHDHPTPQGP